MILLTHNSLRNNGKAAPSGGYPLTLSVSNCKIVQKPYDDTFLHSRLSSLNWPVFYSAANACGITTLPAELTDDIKNQEGFLEAVWNVLMCVDVQEGSLTCQESGRVFKIENGIVNFMLEESECEIVRA